MPQVTKRAIPLSCFVTQLRDHLGGREVGTVSWLEFPQPVVLAGKACLFLEDQKFPSQKGRLSESIDAVPLGSYSLVVKRDYFNKVRGAVRDTEILRNQTRSFVRIDLALRAAQAGWDYEEYQLQVPLCHPVRTSDFSTVLMCFKCAAAMDSKHASCCCNGYSKHQTGQLLCSKLLLQRIPACMKVCCSPWRRNTHSGWHLSLKSSLLRRRRWIQL